jgi:hypothetical protein
MKKLFAGIGVIWLLIAVLAILGWFKDVIHLIHCDFSSPWKAEILYGIGAVTGFGAIFGWFNFGK